MEPIAVIDLENRDYPKGGGWSDEFDLGVVLLGKDGKEKSSATFSGSGLLVGAKFKGWMEVNRNPVVTSFNQSFDRRRLIEGCRVNGLEWGPDIRVLAWDAMNKEGATVTLPNGFKKWPSLDEAAIHYGLGRQGVHSPVEDARLASKVLLAVTPKKEEASTMPVKECQEEGKPGFKYGDSGKCYTYTEGDEASKKAAQRKAHIQGYAIEMSQKQAGKTPD